jgi:copper(I)-binding protein
MMMTNHMIVALAVTMAMACTSGETPESIDLEVSQVFVTEPVTGERAAMYFSVTNNGSVDDELLAVSTAAAAVAEVHRTEHEGGTMKMVPVDALTVPAGGRVDLAPGGYHVMLLDLAGHFFPDDHFDVTAPRSRGTFLSGRPLRRDAPLPPRGRSGCTRPRHPVRGCRRIRRQRGGARPA